MYVSLQSCTLKKVTLHGPCRLPQTVASLEPVSLQILNQFKIEGLESDLVEMQRYAAWKAADIRKALREGRTPTPGASGDDAPSASTLTPSGTPLQEVLAANQASASFMAVRSLIDHVSSKWAVDKLDAKCMFPLGAFKLTKAFASCAAAAD